MTTTVKKEKHLEHALTRAVKTVGGICWKLTCPGTTGVPDRICLKAGRAVFVELKSPGKKPRPIQSRRIAQLRAQGFPVFVIDHPDQIEGVLDALSAA